MLIYIDILIFTNTIINYCILICTQKFLHINHKHGGIVCSSIVSALFSLIIFIPINSFILNTTIKLLCSGIMCFIAFYKTNSVTLVKSIITSFIIAVLFSGAMVSVFKVFKPKNMIIVNDIVYFQYSPILMIIIAVFIYLIIYVLQKLFSDELSNTLVHLDIYLDDIKYSCIGKIDTGSSLVEPFSGNPVILTENSILKYTGNRNT
ncbi:MAG: sigma-E processing peptidase SpoIIGA, partial [Ruminococcus sp.]|nr:sigma-E processing peptidase SpoIIGA [Ruminococcus sp.]